MEEDVVRRRRKKGKKKKHMKHRTDSYGANLDELEAERNIMFDIDDNRKRRTIQLIRENGSCGFTIQTYGVKNKKNNEVEVFTFVDYVEVTGPAHKAGLRKGDIILSVNGQNVEFATHRELVSVIQSAGETLRMVVLFVDCCRKVELYDRLIKLKRVLLEKVKEYKLLERQEEDLIDEFCINHGLERLTKGRRSVMSTSSSLSSWDAYSLLNSPGSLLNLPNTATSHFAQDYSYSSSSRSSFEGDNSFCGDFDVDYSDISYMDDDDESDDDDTSDYLHRLRSRRSTIRNDDSNTPLEIRTTESPPYERDRRDTLIGINSLQTDLHLKHGSTKNNSDTKDSVGNSNTKTSSCHENDDPSINNDSKNTEVSQHHAGLRLNNNNNYDILKGAIEKGPNLAEDIAVNVTSQDTCHNCSADSPADNLLLCKFNNRNDFVAIPFMYEGEIYINENDQNTHL